jgi:septum formation protein
MPVIYCAAAWAKGSGAVGTHLLSGASNPLQNKIILASSSSYRRQLLDRLHLDYECRSPNIDESVMPGEQAVDYVCRLAEAKALSVGQNDPQAVVIGSDQCALLGDEILGKPGSHARALEQLRQSQGKTVIFHTAVCVLNLARSFCMVDEVPFEVEFRNLSDQQLEHYLRVEQPYDCAGSFKAEGYGACLFKALRGDDPNALIGLPLLRLTTMLESAGVEVV